MKKLTLVFIFALVLIVLVGAVGMMVIFITAPAPTPTPVPTVTPSPTPIPTPTPAPTPTMRPAVPVVVYDENINIPIGHYTYLYDNKTFAAGTNITIALNASDPVTFLLLNQSNFQPFVDTMDNRNPQTWDYYIFKPTITNEIISFNVPVTDYYYIVIDNSGALTPYWAPINATSARVMVVATT